MPESIGLVLAGGGARGAYEVGALSALLPWLEQEHGQRPDVIVGTSVGALNAAFIASRAHEDMSKLIQEGSRVWREISYGDVLAPLWSIGEVVIVGRLAASLALGVAPYSLLDPAPLKRTLARLIAFGQIHENVANREVGLRACAVVATAAHTNRTVVFHDGGPNPASDERRGIDYVPTEVREEHVRASAAIPAVFPAVEVGHPGRGWYFDGGTRLNTPIKPALKLRAERLIVIGLNSVAPAPRSRLRPDLFDGASQIVQGLLVDPVVNDVQTLATVNETLLHVGRGQLKGGQGPRTAGRGQRQGGRSPRTVGRASGRDQRRVVPYIFVFPDTPNAIGEIAAQVYRECYGGPRGPLRSPDLALLGRLVGADRNSTRGELFSYLFFAREFTTRLIELGRNDAWRWIERRHDDGHWQVGKLRVD